MTKAELMKALSWSQRVILRGIEGLISDKYLLQVIKSENFDEAVMNQMEAKYMAEAVYAQGRGWTD